MLRKGVDGLGPNDGFRAVRALRVLADELEAEHVMRCRRSTGIASTHLHDLRRPSCSSASRKRPEKLFAAPRRSLNPSRQRPTPVRDTSPPVTSSWRLPALLAELGVNVEELRRIASGA